MSAVIRTGGKQYRVARRRRLRGRRELPAEKNQKIVFDSVLMVSGDSGTQIGTPTLEAARVACEVVEGGSRQKDPHLQSQVDAKNTVTGARRIAKS